MALIQMAEYIESLGMEDLVSIVVPDHDFQNRVLYLLHGMMGDYSSYFREHDMERLANEKGVLIVMPSVQNSIYTNMEHGGAFCDYVAKELPERMEAVFCRRALPVMRYIAGCSMGGTGAMKIGFAYPGKYRAIGAVSSGAINFSEEECEKNPAFATRWHWIFGDREWRETIDDTFYMVRQAIEKGVSLPKLYHCGGKLDPYRSQFLRTRDYFAALPEGSIDYFYDEGEGGHTEEFMFTHLQYFIHNYIS